MTLTSGRKCEVNRKEKKEERSRRTAKKKKKSDPTPSLPSAFFTLSFLD